MCPTLVFIDCEVPPPPVLADHRLQKEREVLIPMTQLSMSWSPYLPNSISDIGPGELPTECRINVLTWKRRPENFAPLMILKELKELATLYPVAKDADALARAEQLVSRALPDAYKAAGAKYVTSMRRMKDMSPDECKREVNVARGRRRRALHGAAAQVGVLSCRTTCARSSSRASRTRSRR
jgi:hypothetical protein